MKPFVTSFWVSVLAKRAEPLRLLRAGTTVSDYGQVLTELEEVAEIRGVLTPLRGAKALTDKLTERVGDALLFTEAELLTGDFVEREGQRWEVLTTTYWPDQCLTVAEVRRVSGAESGT